MNASSRFLRHAPGAIWRYGSSKEDITTIGPNVQISLNLDKLINKRSSCFRIVLKVWILPSSQDYWKRVLHLRLCLVLRLYGLVFPGSHLFLALPLVFLLCYLCGHKFEAESKAPRNGSRTNSCTHTHTQCTPGQPHLCPCRVTVTVPVTVTVSHENMAGIAGTLTDELTD